MRARGWMIVLCCLVSSSAMSAPIPGSDADDYRPQNSADHQAEKANRTTMPWCTAKFTADPWTVDQLVKAIHSFEHDFAVWADAAERLCEHKEDPTWVRAATNLVQRWMNTAENSQAEAEKQISEKIASNKADRSPAGLASAEEAKFAFNPASLTEVAPELGVDQAKITDKPAWCDQAGKFAIADRWNDGRISRTAEGGNGIQGRIEAALHICQRPTDKTWKQYATILLQRWMNSTHLSQPDAEKSLRARIQIDQFEAQRVELCKALDLGAEVAGQVKTYGEAQRDLFGCNNRGQTLWQDASQMNTSGVGFYLDSDSQPDELMRVYWLFGFVRNPSRALPAKDAEENQPLLYYAIAQNDFAHLDVTAIDKTLSAAPYNDYARTVMLETLGRLKAEQKLYEQAIDKMTKGDEDYAAILRKAPQKAFAQWDKSAAQWKPEIDRSNAFEKLLSQPSRKALKGCSVELKKDGEKLIKSFKTSAYKELTDKIKADPIANLLMSRIAICYAAENMFGASGAVQSLVSHGRELRGPRSLAYYAIVDAIVEAKKDRPRLLFDLSGFYQSGGALSGNTNIDMKDFDFSGQAPSEWEKTQNRGVVASIKKVDQGLQVSFKKVTLAYPDYDCTDDTRHPLRINSDGRIEYYQNCKALGTVSHQDITPSTIVIAPVMATGIKPGVFLEFFGFGRLAKNNDLFAGVAFTKNKSDDKKITTFLGFGL
ncbi:MAG: hypothetical protein JWO36_819 [Myxococcales bacterium]|nr:hypothetical protein [Myxococcales bacterium]